MATDGKWRLFCNLYVLISIGINVTRSQHKDVKMSVCALFVARLVFQTIFNDSSCSEAEKRSSTKVKSGQGKQLPQTQQNKFLRKSALPTEC